MTNGLPSQPGPGCTRMHVHTVRVFVCPYVRMYDSNTIMLYIESPDEQWQDIASIYIQSNNYCTYVTCAKIKLTVENVMSNTAI